MADTDFYVVIPTPVLEMGPYCIAVYAVLRDFADSRSDECWPSHQSIAARCALSVPSVKRALARLRDAGWVTWESRANGKQQTSNRYKVHGVARSVRSSARSQGSTPRSQRSTPRSQGSTELIPKNYYPGTNSSSLADASDGETDPFDQFWTHYPRKVGKDAARKAWAQAVKRADPSHIITAALRFRHDPNLPTDRGFIPHPATWLNQGRWDDEPLPERSNGTKAPSGAAMFMSLPDTHLMEVEA